VARAATSRIEISVIIDYVALRSPNIAKACGTIHLPCLLDLLVNSYFCCLWSRLFVASLVVGILDLRN
jgi:hypothetical protein